MTPTTSHRRTAHAVTGAALAAALAAVPAQGAFAAEGPERSVRGHAPSSGGWQKDGLRLDAEQNRAVDAFLDRAERAERHLSPQIRTVAAWSGAELVGFDQRLKTPDSLKRKVAGWLRADPDQTVHEALGDINDSVRYTFQWPDEQYTEGARSASATLAAWGHGNSRWSNTWRNRDSDKAINSAWRDADSGHTFEIQMHTPVSFRAAKLTHPLYEEQRLPDTPPERVAELKERQARIFAAVPVPAGAERLTGPGVRPEPVPDSRPVPLPAPVG